MIAMGPREIQPDATRDSDALRLATELEWAERIRQHGPAEGFRIADELRKEKIAQDPGWPSQADREADLAHHVRMAELFRRIGRLDRR